MLRYTKHVTSQRYTILQILCTTAYMCPTNTVILIKIPFWEIFKIFLNVSNTLLAAKNFCFDEALMKTKWFQFCMLDDWKNFPQTGFWFHIFQTMFLLHHPHPFSARSYSSFSCFYANSGLTLLCHNVGDSKQ